MEADRPKLGRLTITAVKSKCGNVAQEIAAQTGATVVVPSFLADKEVSYTVIDRDYVEALEILARVVETELVIRDGVYYLGEPKEADKVVLVSRVRGASPAEAQSAATLVIGSGRVQLLEGVIVATGLPSEIERVARTLKTLEGIERSQWAIQFYLITMTERDLADFGLTTNPALDLAVGQASGSAVGLDGVELRASLRTVLTAAEERSSVGITARPLLMLMDGGQANFTRGASVSIPRKSVSDQGTVTTIGFETVQTGTTIDVNLRELTSSTVRADVVIELSDLVEVTVEGGPSVQRRRVNLPVALTDGGTYLLASLELDERRENRGRWLRWGGLADQSAEVLQVWATVARIAATTGEVSASLQEEPGVETEPAPSVPSSGFPVKLSPLPRLPSWLSLPPLRANSGGKEESTNETPSRVSVVDPAPATSEPGTDAKHSSQ